MKKTALHSLSLDNFIRSGRTIIEEFNPKKFVFIDSLGQWKEDPKTIEECISNELLYHIWKLEDDKQASFIHNIFYIFKKYDSWLMAKKIKLALGEDSKSSLSSLTNNEIDKDINNSYSHSSRPKRSYPFLIILEALGWILKYEAIKLNCELLVPEWNLMAKTQQQKYRKHLESLDKFLNELFIEKKGQKLIWDTVSQLNKKSPESIKAIPRVIAEEDRLIKTINRIHEEAKDTRKKEEVFSFIVEKIHPPMGVVTNTSAALLRSCLKLLMDDNIEIESGIQYNASVILSIPQDTRATETLLKTFERFPLYYSKIEFVPK